MSDTLHTIRASPTTLKERTLSDQAPPPPSPTQPDSDTETASVKPKWSKGKLAGAIGGGCCGLILLALIGLMILGLIFGPTEDPEPSSAPTTAEETTEAPAEETTEAEPTEEATTEAPVEETTEEEPVEEATSEPEEQPAEADDPQAWAAAVEETALVGSTDWQEACGGDYSLGMCWITDVSADRIGNLNVTIQLTGSDAESKDLAEGAANYIFATAGPEHEDLNWVIVHGADGVVIKQKQRSDYPLLD